MRIYPAFQDTIHFFLDPGTSIRHSNALWINCRSSPPRRTIFTTSIHRGNPHGVHGLALNPRKFYPHRDSPCTGAYGTVSTCEGQILVLKLDRTNGSTSTIHSSVSSGPIDTLPLALDTLLSHVQLRSANLSQKTASRRFTISLKFGPHFNPQDFAFWG
jgi:hypothetical protein